MFLDYLKVFFMSMVPVVELRGAAIYSQYLGLPVISSFIVCIIGNMIPVPFIYYFLRKLLHFGEKFRLSGRFCRWILEKGEKAGRKLSAKGRKGMFIALVLFVGIPIPGTGAWTGTLGASILDMGIKLTSLAVVLGLIMAGTIMMTAAVLGFGII
ncbi:MAG: small multi-drug export protein [Firmicutes bacterium]|nr:small multi-drug export protein [Bacillota bacterium]